MSAQAQDRVMSILATAGVDVGRPAGQPELVIDSFDDWTNPMTSNGGMTVCWCGADVPTDTA